MLLPSARVLSIASRTNAKSLHARWPIRVPKFLQQSERHNPAAPIRTRELLSRLTDQRRLLTRVDASGKTRTPHALRRSRLNLFSLSFRPHYLSLASVPFSVRGGQRVTLPPPPHLVVYSSLCCFVEE